MKSDLEPRLAESEIGRSCILHGMPPSHHLQDPIPGALHPQFHLGCTQIKHLSDVGLAAVVRPGLEGGADVSHSGALIGCGYGLK